MTNSGAIGWLPFGIHKTFRDLELLGVCEAFSALSQHDSASLIELLDVVDLVDGQQLVDGGAQLPGMLIVLQGCIVGGSFAEPLPIARPWGAEAMLEAHPALSSLHARGAARVALLRRQRFEGFAAAHPAAALAFLRHLMAEFVRAARPTPRSSPPRLQDVLPLAIDGALVVAGRANGATRSLLDTVEPNVVPTPVTVRDWEGREIYRRSAGLACLEAARRAREYAVTLGPSWTSGRLILGLDPSGDRGAQAAAIQHALDQVVGEALPFEELSLHRDQALRLLEGTQAGVLVSTSGSPSVALNRLGGTLVLSPGPLLPNTGYLRELTIAPYADTLSLDFGPNVRDALPKRPMSTMLLEGTSPRYPTDGSSRGWLEKLGIVSVGAFNRACISGEVRNVIDVAEGFHEKRIAELADLICARPEVKIVAVAGPSSSGKTTFLKRLSIQLRVAGLRPVGLSLDDYYVDREQNVRDASGEYDFEALEAINLSLFGEHIAALLEGRTINTARYDFVTGRSAPAGGEALSLGQGDVLLVEGIHGLNPCVFSDAATTSLFRVFIHPATSLPFDSLSTLEPADVRLLRRIVRDRHSRGTSAAQNLARWPSVRRGERLHIDPHRPQADFVFDTSLIYELSVLRVFAERYLLEVREDSPQHPGALRLLRWMAPFVPIYPDRVPPTSILREFIGGSGFSY